ncbi:DNA-directed RNA polymerases I, II, and III subunit RPABC4 [Erysiphe neolycopersici]|uniref:DNA-directed RNA polymerases I, II, and III subunit RPABC4 n=1 Tax=Erysiphe neolycopersici TaxID=212602 RepID=A0A420HH00_9PEZI|nr:DNA-directed RNA polymerases I, II, and III subunit RPABC4 [Erysiphe neolycopersici]
MSREAYQVPTAAPLPGRDGYQNSSSSGVVGGIIDTPAINYLCGDCNAKVPLKRGDPIRCKECGHRVLYKERTKRMVQFEAR